MPIDKNADTPERIRKNFQHMAGYHILGEIPTGAVDGANAAFVLVNKPVGGIALFQNGSRKTVTTDYTVSGKTITMTVAPTIGDVLLIDYIF